MQRLKYLKTLLQLGTLSFKNLLWIHRWYLLHFSPGLPLIDCKLYTSHDTSASI